MSTPSFYLELSGMLEATLTIDLEIVRFKGGKGSLWENSKCKSPSFYDAIFIKKQLTICFKIHFLAIQTIS